MERKKSREETFLLNLLKSMLTEQKSMDEIQSLEWKKIIQLAGNHGVLSLLYDAAIKDQRITIEDQERVVKASRQTVCQSYRLLFLTFHIVNFLKEDGIEVVVLKGAGTSGLYPVPELRKSGDIDLLLLNKEDLPQASNLLEKYHFRRNEQQFANHHLNFQSVEGIEIELHTMFAEPFDNKKINAYLEEKRIESKEHMYDNNVMGVILPIFTPAYHAYYLLIHMLQHFMNSGFGLKCLCDWVRLWNQEMEQKEQITFFHMVEESGLIEFAKIVTATCVAYLGLQEEKIAFMEIYTLDRRVIESFLNEVLDAQEYGSSSTDRLVAFQGTGGMAYMREFHHQMHRNHPKLGKVYLLWPVLWIHTLMVFLKNNRIIRKTSSKSILKKARQRSALIQSMKLFR